MTDLIITISVPTIIVGLLGYFADPHSVGSWISVSLMGLATWILLMMLMAPLLVLLRLGP